MADKKHNPEYGPYGKTDDTSNRVDEHVKDAEQEVIKAGDTRCGIGHFKPSCLQPFANMKVFIPTISLPLTAAFAYGIYTMSQVTTLEKQFGITSTESGLMLGANDVGFMLTILLWSHFARKGHKPRILALCGLVFGLSGMLSVVPHFLMLAQAGDMYETTDSSSGGEFDRRSLCLARNATTSGDKSHLSVSSEKIRRIAFAIMFIAFGLQGIAKAPRGPLTTTYIDDNVPKTQTGIYFGVMAGLAILGPVFGSVIGGVFSQMYVTLEETSLTPRDPRWIGAWWLGFLLFASIGFVAAIPLLLFPRRMPNAPAKDHPLRHVPHESSQMETKEQIIVNNSSSAEEKPSADSRKILIKKVLSLVTGFCRSLFRILKNPIYMIIIVCDGVMFLTAVGRITFYPKYLEQYFRVPMGRSNFLFGVSNMVPLAVGVLSGGFLTSRLKLTIRGCLVLRWVTDGVGAVLLFLALLITCERSSIYGLSQPSDLLKLVSPDVTNMTCDTQCMCLEQDFLLSCGADGHNYFSPCHAGCTAVLPNRDFGNCTCVQELSQINQTVTPGYCEGECGTVWIYLALSFVTGLLISLNAIPNNLTKLRCVEDRDRSLSVGLAGLLNSALGFFLGPIVFGRVVDSTCILWSERGSCSLYNLHDLRIMMHVVTGGVLVAIVIVNGLALLLTFKMARYRKIIEWQRHGYLKEREIAKERKLEKNTMKESQRESQTASTIPDQISQISRISGSKCSENTRL